MEKIRTFIGKFASKRNVLIIGAVVVGVWILGTLLRDTEAPPLNQPTAPAASSNHVTMHPGDAPVVQPEANGSHGTAKAPSTDVAPPSDTHAAAGQKGTASNTAVPPAPSREAAPTQGQAGHATSAPVKPGSDTQIEPAVAPPGVSFVEASIAPLEYELKHRFWGWRPNDIINFTDNVNNFQLGVLEVTRRTVVQLTERISRTGSTASLNPNLENAMNWLMVTAQRYWFPSPESKYLESLEELKTYKERLMNQKASFYTRADNLIPLLAAYEDLLGSCDENLVKLTEADGSEVGFLSTDNYFYYAKGVADAMARILEAVHHDFASLLRSRHGEELLHHAILSCQRAAAIDPIFIIDADLDSIFANHRAHMAAPISHARFYIGQLIKTLST